MKTKCKRLLTLLLAAAMLIGTLPAALATDTTPPLYEQLGYASVDDFMDGEAMWNVDYEWVTERYQYHYAQIAADPQLALYWWYDTLSALDEAIEAGEWESREAFYRYAALDNVREDSWSYVPPLSVQLNGATLSFSNAQPEQVNDRTMVPFRTVAEALGAEVGYEAVTERVSAKLGEKTVRFTVGGSELVVSDGETETIGMDVRPYEKNGTTFVPVRFFAEAFGLTVKWDEMRQAVVLMDSAALAAKIDEQFAVLNQWLAAQPKRDTTKATRTALALALSYTELNSIDGDTVYPVSGTMTAITEGQSYEAAVKVDLRALCELLLGNAYLSQSEEIQKVYNELKGDLASAGFEIIYNADENVMYFHSPIVVKLLGVMSPADTKGLSANAWFKKADALPEDLLGYYIGVQNLDKLTGDATVGELFARSAASASDWDSARLWANTTESAEMLARFAGDALFTQSGNSYTAKFHFDETSEAPFALYDGYAKGSLTVNTATGAVKGTFEIRDRSWSDTLTTCTFEGDAAKAHFELQHHVKNQSITKLVIDATQTTNASGPKPAPPASSLVIDLDSWLEAQAS